MPTIRQLIQTRPAKANELFAKLAETSGNAVKTRERLFSELKEELELQMRLEEQHLFPVLRKRKETKDLVPDALNDNKETRKALTELERTPKESEAFASKVAELRKAFQQHVRDERKELLPAVLKALDDEEAGAIVEKFEGAKAEVEAAKRTEAEERRAAAREEREKAEAVARQERERVETVRQAAEHRQRRPGQHGRAPSRCRDGPGRGSERGRHSGPDGSESDRLRPILLLGRDPKGPERGRRHDGCRAGQHRAGDALPGDLAGGLPTGAAGHTGADGEPDAAPVGALAAAAAGRQHRPDPARGAEVLRWPGPAVSTLGRSRPGCQAAHRGGDLRSEAGR